MRITFTVFTSPPVAIIKSKGISVMKSREKPGLQVLFYNPMHPDLPLHTTHRPFGVSGAKLQEHINEKDQIDEEAHDKERVKMQLKQTHLNGRDQGNENQADKSGALPAGCKAIAVRIDDVPGFFR